ncbi:MAG: tRNA (N6-isopentenyl adenosine(37)-C2)-methylthiotransferase MiaB [Rectinema subterraneum]|uniref:tRNA (N6-isopentenyl adenosine(37)-C2)-methylthiotransferase MiaB n=1 Tax=Rectinema subterraneum TaxID=2653714 RepID=UPI003C7CF014
MKQYHIETYGCEMNKAESAAMEATLREHGWKRVSEQDADLVILNTCTVRTTAENRAWNRISQLSARKKERAFALAVVGCMAEQHKGAIQKKAPGVDYVLGTFQKQSFGLMLDLVAKGEKIDVLEETPTYVFGASYHEPGAFRSFVPIMHGCNNFCSYCIVPYVRGREISRNPSDILKEIDQLEDLGVREITLLGQNVNSYRWEEQGHVLDFPGLLKLIARHLHDRHSSDAYGRIGWIRFLTSHPKDLSDSLIDTIAEDPIFCRHIHLPVQSGSNSVLARMNRKYTREYYLSLVERLKAAMPDLTLSTDILVGFPGETDDDAEQTLDLMRQVRFAYSFMYHFNARGGTPAASMPDKVPDKTKKQRLARVIALQKEITSALMRERLGQIDEVLIEGVSRRSKKEVLARTARDEMVVLPAAQSRIGQFARVKLVSISGNTFRGEEV